MLSYLKMIVSQSINNLLIKKLTSFLVILSMCLGASAFLAISNINESLAISLKKNMEAQGLNLVSFDDSKTKLSTEDFRAISRILSDEDTLSSMIRISDGRLSLRASSNFTILGVEPQFFQNLNKKMIYGYPSTGDSGFYGAVVSKRFAEEVLGTVFVNQRELRLTCKNTVIPLVVTGVTDDFPSFLQNAVYVSANTLTRLTACKPTTSFILNIHKADKISDFIGAAKEILQTRHSSVQVSSAKDRIGNSSDFNSSLSLLGMILSVISLVTGGVGIMNVMLLSIAQRRKEIGLRKAIGAPNRTIMIQFVLESGFLSFMGGLVGVFMGMLAGTYIYKLLNIEETNVFFAGTFFLTLGICTLVGIVFGLFPAYKASKLDPYEALRI